MKQIQNPYRLSDFTTSTLRALEVAGIGSGLITLAAFPHLPQVWILAFCVGGLADFALAMIARGQRN